MFRKMSRNFLLFHAAKFLFFKAKFLCVIALNFPRDRLLAQVTIILVDIAYILPPMTSYFLIFVARARIFACIYACISAYTHAYPHIRVRIYISLRPPSVIYSLVFVPICVFLPSYLCRSAAILCGLLHAYMCVRCLPLLDSPSDLSFRVPPVLIARKQL